MTSYLMSTTPQFIRWFADISIGDIPLVGGKNASLGEMFHELSSQGVKVPDGFRRHRRRLPPFPAQHRP
jgi:hypothetical protein